MNNFWVKSLNTSVSAIGFGGAALSGAGGGYGFGDVSNDEAHRLVRQAVDFGINIFDTAPIYGFGLSEERLGEALRPSDNALIISKAGVDWHANKRVNMSNDPAVIERMLHQSLKRLKRDVIDIYMIHWPDAKVDIRDSLAVLVRAKEQGKIKHIGLANTNKNEMLKALEVCAIDVIQNECNLWNLESHHNLSEFLPERLFTGWGTFDKGILSGRVGPDRRFDKSDARSWAPWWNKKEVTKKVCLVDEFKHQFLSSSPTLAELSLLATQIQMTPICALLGAKNISDLEQVVRVIEDFDHKKISELVSLFQSFVTKP